MDYAKRKVGHIKSTAHRPRSGLRALFIISHTSAVRVFGPMHCGSAQLGSPAAEIIE